MHINPAYDINNLWRLGWGYLHLFKGHFVSPQRCWHDMPEVESIKVCEQAVEFTFKRYLHYGESTDFVEMKLYSPSDEYIVTVPLETARVYDGKRLSNLKILIRRKETNHGEARISATGSCLRR